MRPYKLFLYVLLAVLTFGVMGTLLAWSLTQKDVLLAVSASLGAVYLVYFIGLLYLNNKTGWKDEKTVRGRIAGTETMLLHLYYSDEAKRRLVAAAYHPYDPEIFIKILKQNGSNPDMDMFDDVYIGYAIIKPKELKAARNKTVVLAEDVLAALKTAPGLEEFIGGNTFVCE